MTHRQRLQSVVDYIVLVERDRRLHLAFLARMAPGYQSVNAYGLADLCWRPESRG